MMSLCILAVCGIFTAILAVALQPFFMPSLFKSLMQEHFEEDKQAILMSWKTLINLPENRFYNVLIGLNSNLDLIVPAVPLMNTLNISAPQKPGDRSALTNLTDLSAVLGYFMQQGFAAERYFTDARVFKEIVLAAAGVPHAKKLVGGNAGLMAHIMAETFGDSVEVVLVGPVGPQLAEILDTSISVPPECKDERDEVHLILEYGVGETWEGMYPAPVANRFILSHDVSNSQLLKLNSLQATSLEVKPDLVVISGLHMTEALSLQDWSTLIGQVGDNLNLIGRSTMVHLELASMTSQQRMAGIAEKLFPLIDSLGLNEQELAFVSQSAGGPHTSLTDTKTGQPTLSLVIDVMDWLLHLLSRDVEENGVVNRLSRIHFHSLTYHVIGVRVDQSAVNLTQFSLSALSSAVGAGARMAGQRACDPSAQDPSNFLLKLPPGELSLGSKGPTLNWRPADSGESVVTWTAACKGCAELRFALSPVLVCRNPVRTVGLGDSISATGLLYTPKR